MSWREFDILLRGLSPESVTMIKMRTKKAEPKVLEGEAGWAALSGALGISPKKKARA